MHIADTIIYLLISLLVMLEIVGIILGTIFAVVASDETDPIRKKKFKKVALYCFFLPILLLIVVLVVWVLLNITGNTLSS